MVKHYWKETCRVREVESTKKKSYSMNGAWCLIQSKCSISIYEVNEWFPEKTEGAVNPENR